MSPRGRKRDVMTPDADRPVQFSAYASDLTPGVPFVPAVPVSATDERRERELEEWLDEIGSDGRLTVWHVIDGKATYAGNMSLDGFSLDALLDAYGGGEKSLVLYQGKEKKATVRVSLDPLIPPRSPRSTKLAVAAPASAAPASSLSDVAGFITAMAAAQQTSITMMQSMAQQNAQTMQTMLTAMTTALTAKPETTNPLEIVKTVAELMHKNSPAETSQKDLLDMLERGLSLRDRFAGDDDGDGVIGVVKEGVGALGSLIEGIVAEKKANAAAALAAANAGASALTGVNGPALPDGRPENPSTHEGGEMPAGERPAWLPDGVAFAALLQVAQWVKPAEAAQMIADRLTDEQFAALIDDIETPGFAERLVRAVPVVRTVKPEWIGEVISILLSDYVEDSGVSDAAPNAGGESVS